MKWMLLSFGSGPICESRRQFYGLWAIYFIHFDTLYNIQHITKWNVENKLCNAYPGSLIAAQLAVEGALLAARTKIEAVDHGGCSSRGLRWWTVGCGLSGAFVPWSADWEAVSSGRGRQERRPAPGPVAVLCDRRLARRFGRRPRSSPPPCAPAARGGRAASPGSSLIVDCCSLIRSNGTGTAITGFGLKTSVVLGWPRRGDVLFFFPFFFFFFFFQTSNLNKETSPSPTPPC